jgi:3D (Asp-Asp-Asp) domain-containing protein
MARTRELKVIIAGDADKLDRELKRSNKSLDDLGKHTRLTASITSKGFHGMRLAATGAIGAVGGLTFAMKGALEAASDINESLTKNQALFGKYAKGIERFAKTSATALGISRREALAAAGTFGGLFDAINIGEKDSAKMSQRLVKLAADLASFNNASPEEALEALRSGLSGEAEPMRRFNAFLSETRVQAEAMRMGIGKAAVDTVKLKAAQESAQVAQERYNVAVQRYGASSVEAMSAHVSMVNAQERAKKATEGGNVALTEAQKVQARYSLILRDTAKAHGDFARTSQGDANQTRILKAQYADLTAELGNKLLPIKLKATRAVNKFVTEMQNGTGQGGKFVAVLEDIWQEAKPVVQWVAKATQNIAEFAADHPDVTRLAAAVVGVGAAIKGLKMASAATGFTDLLKVGSSAARLLRRRFADTGTRIGEEVAVNAASNFDRTSKTKFAGVGRNAGKTLGKGVLIGLIAAMPALVVEINKQITKALGLGDSKESGGLFRGGGIAGLFNSVKKLFGGDGTGKRPAKGGKAGNLMGARSSLAPFAAIGAGYGLQVTSGKRPGSITSSGNVSYHSTGEAIDMSGGAAAMMDYAKWMKAKYGKRLAELIYTPMGLGIKNGRPFKYTGQVAADHFDHVHVALDTGKPGVGDGLGKFRSTAYGPPWGGIQGTGVTASGVNLKGSPHIYGVAADPSILPLGSRVKINPNPFGYGGTFKVFDTGGAIKGRRIDFYDWRGRKSQMAWGSRSVNVSTVGGSSGGGSTSTTAEALQKQSDANQTRIDKLRNQLDRLPKGLAGAVQRDKIQAQIRAIQATQRGVRADLRDAPTAAERQESQERSGSRLVNKIVQPFMKGFRVTSGRAHSLGTEIEDLDTSYGQAERAFNLTDEDLGTAGGRKQRVSELAALAALKAKTLDRQKKRAAALQKAIANRESMLRKLRTARARTKGAKRAKISERIRSYEDSLDDLKAELRSLGFAIRDTELDIGDLMKEAKEAATTPDTEPEAGPTVSDRVSDLMGLIDLKERAGVYDTATAQAQRTALLQSVLGGSLGPLDERTQLQLMGDLRDVQQAGVAAVEDNTNAIKELKDSIDANTRFAQSVLATENASLLASITDLISGQIAGFGIAGRGLMPGTAGVRARY